MLNYELIFELNIHLTGQLLKIPEKVNREKDLFFLLQTKEQFF